MDLEKQQERCRAQQERAELVSRGKSILKELLLHLVLILIVVSLSYGTNDQNSYYVFKTISDMFFDNFKNKASVDIYFRC